MVKAFMNWSGGKDSALALYKAKEQGIPVEALITAVNRNTNRISMHGVRRELLELQAASVGLPLFTIELPDTPDMNAYEAKVRSLHQELKEKGFTHGIFGDIFLEDLKTYRENLLAKDELGCIFPLWKSDGRALIKDFVVSYKALIVCVNSNYLNQSFCGRLLDQAFVNDLPATADCCGENGEYHSFVFDGPLFSSPVNVRKTEIVFRGYPSPTTGDCFSKPQQSTGFYFQDLIMR